jgi:TonB-dependent SusC/RagA subfamily outer membrane receptor
MKVLIGTLAAAVLVLAACETPAPERILSAPGPDASRSTVVAQSATVPLVIIDGVRQNVDSAGTARLSYHVSQPRVISDGVHSASGATVRGPATSLSSSNERLRTLLSTLPRDQIQSIEVLKGDAATAEYGSAARYGVIIIHTKADTTAKQ